MDHELPGSSGVSVVGRPSVVGPAVLLNLSPCMPFILWTLWILRDLIFQTQKPLEIAVVLYVKGHALAEICFCT